METNIPNNLKNWRNKFLSQIETNIKTGNYL